MLDGSISELSFTSQGSGNPTLVFLHYFSGAAASWQWVMEELKPSFRCITLDLPGFGNASPLAEPSLKNYSVFVREALVQLGMEQLVLIGHSMGGKIALQVAADMEADTLKRVILVAPSPPTQEPMPADERDRLLGNHHRSDVATTTVESATHKPLSDAQRTLAISTHNQAEDRTWRWWLLDGMNHSIADRLNNIKVPVGVIASADDPVIPLDTIKKDVMALLPTAELTQLSGVGHLIPLESPEQLAQNIRQMISSDQVS
ncbi:MAG: alpha/beta hydrolase [Cyanobacteria bacterium P01_D01_bin.56]